MSRLKEISAEWAKLPSRRIDNKVKRGMKISVERCARQSLRLSVDKNDSIIAELATRAVCDYLPSSEKSKRFLLFGCTSAISLLSML